MTLKVTRQGVPNKVLIDHLEKLSIEVPPLEQRKDVFKYLLKVGFAQKEAESFDCMGRDYEIVVKAMEYDKLRACESSP